MKSGEPLLPVTYNADDDRHLPERSTELSQPVRIYNPKNAEIHTRTIPTVFRDTSRKFPDKTALVSMAGKTWSWTEYYNDSRKFAKSLMKIGFQPHQAINVLGFNAPEWFLSTMGAVFAGGVAAGIYTTNNAEACHYIAEHSEAAVVVVEGRAQLAKFLQIQHKLPKLKALVVYHCDEGFVSNPTAVIPIYTFDEFMELGADVDTKDLDVRGREIMPGHCCTLIYTSGTTGPPKAVMVSHDNIFFAGERAVETFSATSADVVVSYLPLSHIAGQILDLHVPMRLGGHTHFARPDALKGTITDTLKVAKPTVFFGVPRVWEKIMEKMIAKGRGTKGLKRKLIDWAKRKGTEYSTSCRYENVEKKPACFGVANKLIFMKIKKQLGLDRMRLACSAAAPLSVQVMDFFSALNIQIYESFGQSETTGLASVHYPGMYKVGTVGVEVDDTELRLTEDQSEIIYRGRHIFMGYLKMPEKTAESFDNKGFLHSGDVGKIDKDGFLTITGRIKELIVTAGGENVAPVLIEDCIKKHLPCVSNVMIIGDKKKYLTCLITLKVEINDDGTPSKDLDGESLLACQKVYSVSRTTPEAMRDEGLKKYIKMMLDVANKEAISKAQKVQKFFILENDFSQFTGELTPTLKLKRSVVHNKYKDIIESLY